MVSNCANPKCGKPLHYLRDGRIFVFDVQNSNAATDGKKSRHLEHFWLCGPCSQTFAMEQSTEGVRLIPRPGVRIRAERSMATAALVS